MYYALINIKIITMKNTILAKILPPMGFEHYALQAQIKVITEGNQYSVNFLFDAIDQTNQKEPFSISYNDTAESIDSIKNTIATLQKVSLIVSDVENNPLLKDLKVKNPTYKVGIAPNPKRNIYSSQEGRKLEEKCYEILQNFLDEAAAKVSELVD